LLYQVLKNPDNRDISFWVNSILNTSIYQAVKTWTSSDFRDNWIISYHPDLIVWIWVWNNDNSSMQWVTWITGAWYLWHQIIEYAIKNHIIQDVKYKIPNKVEKFYYCLDKDCIKKQASFKKKSTTYFSAINDWIYDKRDLFENLDEYELNRLNSLWFKIK
jgi:membrane carboxypeptidase/penicillin-binding protein PbpC